MDHVSIGILSNKTEHFGQAKQANVFHEKKMNDYKGYLSCCEDKFCYWFKNQNYDPKQVGLAYLFLWRWGWRRQCALVDFTFGSLLDTSDRLCFLSHC